MILRFGNGFRLYFLRVAMIAAATVIIMLVSDRSAAQSPDAAEDIRPPKALVEIPPPKKPLLKKLSGAQWSGVATGLILLGVATWLWLAHRRKRNMRSPVEIALWSLAELEFLRETISAEAFAKRAADTVRIYIAERFGLAAPRRTTEEFLRDLAQDGPTPLISQRDHLRAFLKSCDMAKFAALPLDVGQRGELIGAGRGFVVATAAPTSNTKPVEVTP